MNETMAPFENLPSARDGLLRRRHMIDGQMLGIEGPELKRGDNEHNMSEDKHDGDDGDDGDSTPPPTPQLVPGTLQPAPNSSSATTTTVLSASPTFDSIAQTQSSSYVPSQTMATIFTGAAITTTYSPSPTILALPLTPSSTQARKGVNGGDHNGGAATTSTSTVLVVETAAAQSGANAGPAPMMNHHPPLSPTAEHALIVVGTLGIVIIIALLTYIVLRLMKIDVLARWQRKPWRPQMLDRGRDGSRSSSELPRENSVQKSDDAPFASIVAPPSAEMQSATALAKAHSERQSLVRTALSGSPKPHNPMTSMQPPVKLDPIEPTSLFGTQDPNAIDQPVPVFQSNNARISDLSSLSSGFGDAIQIPEMGPTALNNRPQSAAYRASRANFMSRFSWTTAPKTPRDGSRDTMYTATSEESAPRFRSVNSWVNQQSSRLLRNKERQSKTESIKEMIHRRNPSEATNPAFKAHPGDEVKVEKGRRIPSEILDGTFGGA